MSLNREDRKCLIISNDDLLISEVQYKISHHVEGFHFFIAQNNTAGMFKLENDLPDLVCIDPQTPNLNLKKFLRWFFDKFNNENIVLILMDKIPEESDFVDEVVIGKMHYLPRESEDLRYSRVLSRALNYISKNYNTKFHLKFLAPGDTLIYEGEEEKSVYIVKSGELEVFIHRDNKNKTIGQIHPGEFVGEMAYLNNDVRSANVIAKTDVELIEIEADRLDHVLYEKPSWVKAMLQTLTRRLKKTIQ